MSKVIYKPQLDGELVHSIVKDNSIDPVNFNVNSFKTLLEGFIEKRFGEVQFNDFDLPDQPIHEKQEKSKASGFVVLNDKFKNKIVKNVIKIELDFLYPQIMKDIIQVDGWNTFNYRRFPETFRILYDLYMDLKGNGYLYQSNIQLVNVLKKWLTYVFGLINNKVIFCQTDGLQKVVTDVAYDFLNGIYDQYKDKVVYIDTDEIFTTADQYVLKKVEESGYKIANKELIDNFLGVAKKKYLTFPNSSDVQVKGFGNVYDEDERETSKNLKRSMMDRNGTTETSDDGGVTDREQKKEKFKNALFKASKVVDNYSDPDKEVASSKHFIDVFENERGDGIEELVKLSIVNRDPKIIQIDRGFYSEEICKIDDNWNSNVKLIKEIANELYSTGLGEDVEIKIRGIMPYFSRGK